MLVYLLANYQLMEIHGQSVIRVLAKKQEALLKKFLISLTITPILNYIQDEQSMPPTKDSLQASIQMIPAL